MHVSQTARPVLGKKSGKMSIKMRLEEMNLRRGTICLVFCCVRIDK
ncbi:MAG: hypothetical protein ACOYBM_03250 [Dethiobacteria bacterium]|nr:hypothetical protein [Bacillota bacterium]